MSRATDLRYGRRGGGWVPAQPTRETRHPHRTHLEPCPSQGCAGQVSIPDPRPTTPYVITCRHGIWTHTFDVTPLEPFTGPGTGDP